jgi:hypothetical protein
VEAGVEFDTDVIKIVYLLLLLLLLLDAASRNGCAVWEHTDCTVTDS